MGTPALPGNFEIAPGHRVREWNSLTLNETDSGTEDWKKARTILDARIRSRFIEPAQLLIDSEKGNGRGTNGFAVLAIDFLLIETIQGFRSGRTNHNGQSEALFKSFLTTWPAFNACVPVGRNMDDLAVRIFKQGRCALHHTGSTDRVVVTKSGKMFVFYDDERININRSRLHQELTNAFDDYLADLEAPSNAGLRKKFKTKNGPHLLLRAIALNLRQTTPETTPPWPSGKETRKPGLRLRITLNCRKLSWVASSTGGADKTCSLRHVSAEQM